MWSERKLGSFGEDKLGVLEIGRLRKLGIGKGQRKVVWDDV